MLVLLNLFLAIIKAIAWIKTGSLAVFSELFNSGIDTLYSILILGGIYISTKEPTDKYPEGYRRLEPFIAILVGVGIIVTSILILLNTINSIVKEQVTVIDETSAIIVLILSAVTKYILYRYCMKVYDQTNSSILAAVGVDNRNDILTIIVALIGVVFSVFGRGEIDAYAAIVVAVAILYSGTSIVRDNIQYILARSVPEDIKNNIRQIVLKNPEVEGVHDLRVHYSGPEIDISVHLEVSGGLTIEEGHKIEKEVIEELKKNCSNPINEINLHIDPKSLEEWK